MIHKQIRISCLAAMMIWAFALRAPAQVADGTDAVPTPLLNTALIPVDVKFKLADGVETLSDSDFNVVENGRLEHDVTDDMTLFYSYDQRLQPEAGQVVIRNGLLRLTAQRSQPGEAAQKRALEFFTGQWKTILEKKGPLTKQQRVEQIQKLNAEEADLSRKVAALAVLDAAKSDQRSLIKEKLQQLRQEGQRLEMELAAKEARRDALLKAVQEQKARSSEINKSDPIVQELQKLVKMREDDVKLKKQMMANGVAPISEGTEAEAQLSEARIRLAEREAALSKSGKGELLDRLSDELAMVSVDVTEIAIHLSDVRSQLKEYDPTSIDAAGLNRVIEREPLLGGSQANNGQLMQKQYSQRLEQIALERFGLSVADVEVTPSGPINYVAGSGRRGGGRAGGGTGGGRRGGIGPDRLGGGRSGSPATQPQ